MTPQRRGPRGDLSAATLLDAAERVLAASGRAGLTLRAVAREAGVAPNALYTYFADAGDLGNALADRFLGRLDPALLSVGPPQAALAAFLRATVAVMLASPQQVGLLAAGPVIGPTALDLNEALLGFFIDRLDRSAADAAAATALLTEWVHGYAVLAASASPAPAAVRALGRLDLARWPRSAAMLAAPDPGPAIDALVRALAGD